MAHDLIVDRSGLTEEMFHRGIQSSNIQLRPGTVNLIAYCRDSDIPTVITSAGITNVIAAVLESHGVSSVHNENFHIGDNMYESYVKELIDRLEYYSQKFHQTFENLSNITHLKQMFEWIERLI
jgi:phosphoserine phosphatase